MDFFSAQDRARRNTARLLFLFVAAVIALVVLTNLAVAVAFGALSPEGRVNPELFLIVTAGVRGGIPPACLFKPLPPSLKHILPLPTITKVKHWGWL